MSNIPLNDDMARPTQTSTPKFGASCRSLKAFTLIELLVVISIIALLVAILLPVLATARTVTRTTICLTTIRQLGMSFHQYAMDNKSNLPRRVWSDIPGGSGYTWPAEFWARGYIRDLRVLSCAEMHHLGGEGDFPRQNSWIIGKPTDSDTMNQFFWQSSHYGYNVRNYGSNFRINSASNWSGPTAKIDDIKRASSKLLLADTRRPNEWFNNKKLLGRFDVIDRFSTTDSNGGLHSRHKSSINILWVDMHASTRLTDTENPYLTLGEYTNENDPNNIWSR